MKNKILLTLFLFTFFLLSLFVNNNVVAFSKQPMKNCQTIELSDEWFNDGFKVGNKSNVLKIDMNSIQTYCVQDKQGDIIGFCFENAMSSSDFRQINHFGLKRVLNDFYILELEIENLLFKNIEYYDSNLIDFNIKSIETIFILDTSEKGYEFLSRSYLFNKNINTIEKSEETLYYEFSNISYGNSDTYIDGYSFVSPLIEPSTYEENDWILNIVPENYFFSTGENSFQGKEYGVYKNTFYEMHPYYNIGRYVTSVFVYDIEVAYSGLHGDKDNNSSNSIKYSIKPLFSGMYYGYSKTNISAWNSLGLNSDKDKMVIICNAYQQKYYLNVDNLNVMDESTDGAYGFTDISFNFDTAVTISSILEESKIYLGQGIQSLLQVLPGSSITTKLYNFASTLYQNSQPSPLEQFIEIQNNLDKYNYNYELDNFGYPAFVSIPYEHNFNSEFLNYDIHSSKYSYNYKFRQNNRLISVNNPRFDFFNLYISSALSIYRKNQNKLDYVSSIISSNDYGVQGYNSSYKEHSTISNYYETSKTISEVSTFQYIVFNVTQSGYYTVELSSPSNPYARKKAVLYNSDGNSIAQTDEPITGINKMAVYLNANTTEQLTGKYYLRFSFDESVIGEINVKISFINTIKSSSMLQSFTFSSTEKIQYAFFCPTITKKYTISTTSDMDPSVTMYKSMISRYSFNYFPFAYDNSMLSIPYFHQDDGYDYDPEEMYPNLNCYFKMELNKNTTYIFKIKNNDVINFGQLSFSIE